MELTQLSSNWKKLQQTLAKEKTAKTAQKRKALESSTNELANGHTAKRRKPAPRRSMHIIRKPTTHAAANGTATPEHATTDVDGFTAPDTLTANPPAQAASSSSLPADCLNTGLDPAVRISKYVAIDCEMVGVGPSPSRESALARVSLVNYHGTRIYDALAAPREAVTDHRSAVSGITPAMLRAGGGARPLDEVQKDVAQVLKGRILVGHAVQNDLQALFLSHPSRDIRDTSRYGPYRRLVGGRTPGLRRLARDLLGLEIQGGAHSSVEDARATMALFRREKGGFEKEAVRKYGVPKKVAQKRRPELLEDAEPEQMRPKQRRFKK